ncbi:MAG: hypothetical protein JWO13_2602 [Acidobacteriales bacterium]|nr:hypothetical protein [Terriglobales bacterium]
METLLQDLRYSLRTLRNSPGFTAVAVLTLALGIGANTAIFTLINAVMLKMLPAQNAQELVVLGDPTAAHSRSMGTPTTELFSYPLYRELRDRNAVFSGVMAAGEMHKLKVTRPSGEGVTDDALGALVSGNYFSVLGVNTLIGRPLTDDDDKLPGAHPVAVISYSLWKQKFALSPDVLGQSVRLNGYPFTIIGVTPQGFYGQVVGDVQEVWIPIMMQAQVMPGRNWITESAAAGNHQHPENVSWLNVMARLKPGVTVEAAKANVNLVFKQMLEGSYGAKLTSDDLAEVKKNTIDVVPGARGLSELRGDFQKPLYLLMAIVGLVLLIACVNVANLLLARASQRKREIAVRLALGAKPSRLVRQLLTESVVLAFFGGAFGLFAAMWGARVLLKVSSLDTVKNGLEVQPDLKVLAFTAGICVLTGLIFGLVPALRAVHVELNSTLKSQAQGNGGSGGRGWNWGKLLVVSQVGLSLLVLFAAGLLVRSLRNLQNLDVGYNRQHLVLASIDPVAAGYNKEQISALVPELTQKMARIPGVQAASVSAMGLFSGIESANTVKVEGFAAANDRDKVAYFDRVAPDYFKVLGIPLLLGREISAQDREGAPVVAVINESMAKFYFKNENPVGRKFWIDDEEHRNKPILVVGVAKDARDRQLRGEVRRRYYLSITQPEDDLGSAIFEIRTVGDPEGVTNSVRSELKNFNSAIPINSVRTLDYLVDNSISNEIIIAKLSSFFGGLALLLASIGLYGIMSYTVNGRTKEIGVRMALGAQRKNVLWLILREAMILVVAGIAVGIPAAIASTKLISSMLYGLSGSDPVSMAAVILLLGSIAVVASYIPARRATKVDPMVALRYE